MKRLVSALIAFGVLIRAQVPGSGLPVEQRAWVASKLYASIQMFNAHSEGAPGFDLDREYRAYLKVAMEAADRRAFDLATIAFAGKLRNGHSGFYDSWLLQNHGQPLGFSLLPMTEGWVVTTSQLPGLSPGDIVVSVGGKPIENFYAENDAMLEGSSEATRRRKFCWSTHLWPERFDLVLTNGKTVSIDRGNQKLESAKTFPFPQGEVRTPEGIGFIRIQSFEDPAHEMSAVRRVKQLSAAKALIIDVRGNGGGSSPTQLISTLLDRPWRDFRYTTPVHIAHAGAQNQVRRAFPKVQSDPYLRGYLDAFEEFRNADVLTPGAAYSPSADAYKGKVILLVDGFCNSACEDFIQPFKSTGRGILIGEASNGSSGQPYYYDFGDGMSFRVSSKRYYLPDGNPLEGVGIRPDVEIRPSLADWRGGSDPVLAKALQLAAQN
ncbi:MAG: S41 family peptidase [Bryobacteraceae bacterium]